MHDCAPYSRRFSAVFLTGIKTRMKNEQTCKKTELKRSICMQMSVNYSTCRNNRAPTCLPGHPCFPSGNFSVQFCIHDREKGSVVKGLRGSHGKAVFPTNKLPQEGSTAWKHAEIYNVNACFYRHSFEGKENGEFSYSYFFRTMIVFSYGLWFIGFHLLYVCEVYLRIFLCFGWNSNVFKYHLNNIYFNFWNLSIYSK